MTVAEKPFAEKRYSLASCRLQLMDDQSARVISNILAFQDPWLRLGYTEDGLFRYLTRTDPSLNRYAVVVNKETAGVIWATVSSFNTPALSFYKNIGFADIAELPDLVAAGFSEILLQKKCR